MIRLARLSIRRPRAALAVWAIVAVVLVLIGLGVERPPVAVDRRRPRHRVLARADADRGRVRTFRARADPARGTRRPSSTGKAPSSSSRSTSAATRA